MRYSHLIRVKNRDVIKYPLRCYQGSTTIDDVGDTTLNNLETLVLMESQYEQRFGDFDEFIDSVSRIESLTDWTSHPRKEVEKVLDDIYMPYIKPIMKRYFFYKQIYDLDDVGFWKLLNRRRSDVIELAYISLVSPLSGIGNPLFDEIISDGIFDRVKLDVAALSLSMKLAVQVCEEGIQVDRLCFI